MIVNIVNLQNESFAMEFDPEKTVRDLKEEINNACGPAYEVEKQKLVYAGRLMENGRTLKSYEAIERKFIVVMLTEDSVGNQSTSTVGNLSEVEFLAGSGTEENVFDFLKQSPDFLELRTLLLRNPNWMGLVLDVFQEVNPSLFQLISSNRQAFQHFLNEPLDGNGNKQTAGIDAGPPEGAGITQIAATENHVIDDEIMFADGPSTSRHAMEEEENILDEEETVTIHLTHKDVDAINRLGEMGFSKELATQAYLACHKNVQLAADCLISSISED